MPPSEFPNEKSELEHDVLSRSRLQLLLGFGPALVIRCKEHDGISTLGRLALEFFGQRRRAPVGLLLQDDRVSAKLSKNGIDLVLGPSVTVDDEDCISARRFALA